MEIVEGEYQTFTITLEQVVRVECNKSQDPEKIAIDHLYVSSPKELTGYSKTYGRIRIKTEKINTVSILKNYSPQGKEPKAKEKESVINKTADLFEIADELDIF